MRPTARWWPRRWRVSIQRADELAEFVAIYWKDGRAPLSGQVKKGLAAAFTKFDEYALAKYDRAGAVRLRDVLFLCHAKPRDAEQAAVWKRLIDGELATPDTWEVALSARRELASKRDSWERLLAERKLGALALLRNLRNMKDAGVTRSWCCGAGRDEDGARAAVSLSRRCAARAAVGGAAGAGDVPLGCGPREAGRAHSRCWWTSPAAWSRRCRARSEMLRTDAAYGLAVLLREIAEKVSVYTFSDELKRGSAAARLRVARRVGEQPAARRNQPGSGAGADRESDYDRIVVITDEQSHDRVPAPRGKGYMINVASYRNGVGYGKWTHIDGWSEAVIEYIRELEQVHAA